MSNYRSMIDQALEAARARAHTPVETVKTASASDALVKEASDLANALEFISLSASGGDNAAGFRQEMIRDFYKAATSPAQGPTMASGVQGQAPSEGKKKLNPKGLVGGNSPAQSSTTPEAKDGEKTMLESFKQAESASLYDVLMGNKTAGMGGPAEHDSETSAGVTSANENSTYKQTLHTNEGPVNANKRDLKKNTRARLQEAFAHTSDTLGDATAAQIFPTAASKGNLKIAMDPRAAAALAGGAGTAIPLVPFTGTLGAGYAARHVAPDSMTQEEKDRLGMAAGAGALTGGTMGRLLGAATGNPVGYSLGKITGSAAGGALGAHLGMGEKSAMDPRAAAALAGGAGSAIPIVPFTGTMGAGLAARAAADDSMTDEEKNRLAAAAAGGSLTGGIIGRGIGSVGGTLLGALTETPAGMHAGAALGHLAGRTLGSAAGGALGAHLGMPAQKTAGAVGGALLGAGVGAAASEKGKRGKGALIGGVTGGAIGAGGKHLRKRAIDKAVAGGKKPRGLHRFVKDLNDADTPTQAEAIIASQMNRINARKKAYQSRRLKGATGVAAGAGAAGAAAAGTGRFKKKESSEKKASAADRLRWMMS